MHESLDYEALIEEAGVVADAFEDLMAQMATFRQMAGLKETIDSGFEIALGAADKALRVGRHVKHVERNDPKPGFPLTMGQEIFGTFVYLCMIARKYKVDMGESVVAELMKAAEQHGGQA